MRKHQQQQILELIQTLEEAQSVGLYADCQDCALQIGEFIESVEGGGTQTVTLLEEYCELLYRASAGESGGKTLKKHLIKIANSVKSELKPGRIEIVFVSYKASMSDSIESIYLAAKADPDCDAYLIPVPYYDKLSDGSFGQMHYEGAEYYGGNIEVTDWREYDIEARHPDVIFTFNPYDGGNYVTSIHPNFYCERLRSLTDLLVYVPYFVVTNNVSEHFATTAGCVYAHKVIVQSENVRDTYIRVFKEAFGNRFGKPEDKFLALGSPKFDKAMNTKREDCILPDAWRELIGDKKVVFFNTSIGAILKGDEQYLNKLRHVLDKFRQRDDIVLWWRPHPLSQITYSSMRPQLLAEYKRIAAEYRRDGWGIYDDTPSLHRSIAWSDGYYGDWSSVLVLYLSTGKQVMIGDVEVFPNSILLPPDFLFYDRGHIGFFSDCLGAFFTLGEDDCALELLGRVPNEEPNYTMAVTLRNVGLYRGMVEHRGTVYFPPDQADEIAAYSIDNAVFEKILFDRCPNGEVIDRAFHQAVAYNEHIFFIPCFYPGIMRLNTITKEIAYFSDWVKPVRKRMEKADDMLLCNSIAVVGDKVFIPAFGSNMIVEFHMEKCESTVHEIGGNQYRYKSICFDGESLWLSSNYPTPAIKWDLDKGAIKEFTGIYAGNEEMKPTFLPILYSAGYVWFMPCRAYYAYKIDVKTDVVYPIDEMNRDTQPNRKMGPIYKYHFARMHENSIYMYNWSKRMFTVFNCMTGECKNRPVYCSAETNNKLNPLLAKQMMAEIKKSDTMRDCCYHEGIPFSLHNFVDYVISERNTEAAVRKSSDRKQLMRSIAANSDGTAGQAIYHYLRKTILK